MRPGPLEWPFKNYDTGTDKGSWHTKQILAELNQPGGRTIHYEIPDLINSVWNWEETVERVDQCPRR
jgi:hypothetical protein